jgi:hypothetical protein
MQSARNKKWIIRPDELCISAATAHASGELGIDAWQPNELEFRRTRAQYLLY